MSRLHAQVLQLKAKITQLTESSSASSSELTRQVARLSQEASAREGAVQKLHEALAQKEKELKQERDNWLFKHKELVTSRESELGRLAQERELEIQRRRQIEEELRYELAKRDKEVHVLRQASEDRSKERELDLHHKLELQNHELKQLRQSLLEKDSEFRDYKSHMQAYIKECEERFLGSESELARKLRVTEDALREN